LQLSLIRVKHWLAIITLGLLTGCARFEPRPIAPDETATRLEERALDSPDLKAFLEHHLGRELATWPLRSWDFESLTLAAFYYNPSLEVARAQWAVARGGEKTAGQSPNPTLNVTPGYNTTTFAASPWFPLTMLDVTLETAGKRSYRKAQAAQLSEAGRLNIITVAWQVRSELQASTLDFIAAQRRVGLLEQQIALQEQIVNRLEQQSQAGAVAMTEVVPLRGALAKGQLELADARRQTAEGRARMAEALGVPARAVDGLQLGFDWLKQPRATEELTTAEARRAALLSRADVLGALADYGASQAALQLEIAKQYPDLHLQPGYQFDQGDNKWSLGLTVELPVFHHNQGPIAEAKAHREVVAARFLALQAKVIAEIDRALAIYAAAREQVTRQDGLAQLARQQAAAVEARRQAGAADQLELAGAKLEAGLSELASLDAQLKIQQAVGQLEAAVQRPRETWPNLEQSPRAETKKDHQ
jgi:outer membrane protein TolC